MILKAMTDQASKQPKQATSVYSAELDQFIAPPVELNPEDVVAGTARHT